MVNSLITWARGILRTAQRDLAIGPKADFGAVVLPFDSRLNIYDRDVHEVAKSLIPSKGQDDFALNRAVNAAVGRHVVPENNMDVLLFKIASLEKENKALKERVSNG